MGTNKDGPDPLRSLGMNDVQDMPELKIPRSGLLFLCPCCGSKKRNPGLWISDVKNLGSERPKTEACQHYERIVGVLIVFDCQYCQAKVVLSFIQDQHLLPENGDLPKDDFPEPGPIVFNSMFRQTAGEETS